jgi:putative ABC transport system substrate-binding protein
VLANSSPETGGYFVDAFTQRMRDLGYVEGKDIVYDVRWAQGKGERLAELARELVALHPDVILTTITAGTLAARQATVSIPIVARGLSDPVGNGLARSLARPGRNVTGLADLNDDISPKRLELLRAAVPNLTRLVILQHPAEPASLLVKTVQEAGGTVGVDVVTMKVSTPAEIDVAFASMARGQVGGVIVAGVFLSVVQSRQVVDLALRHRMPTMFGVRRSVEIGGLMSYAVNILDTFRRAATYVDKILKGANPGDLPIEQATTLELVINLKTAKAIGVTIPQSLLLRADEVIQ